MPMLTLQQARSDAVANEAEQRTTSPEHKRLLSERGEHDTTIGESKKRRKLSESLDTELVVTGSSDDKTSKKIQNQKETIDGVTMLKPSDKKKVDPTELASAFALASLASLSPGGSSVGSASGISTPPRESREANVIRKTDSKLDDEVRKAASFESETRSPKASEHPLSPEQLSLREQEDHSASSTVVNSPAGNANRRVSFAPNTKSAEESKVPSTPTTSASSSGELATSTSHRSLAMPQESPGGKNGRSGRSSNSNTTINTSPNSMMQMSPRPHRMYGGRGLPPFVRTPPQVNQMNHRLDYGTPPPPPHAPYHHRLPPPGTNGSMPPGSFRHGPPVLHHRQQFGYPGAPPGHRFSPHQQYFPPRYLMQPPLLHRTNSYGVGMVPSAPTPPNQQGAPATTKCNQWVCDYCNVASFSSYEEACAHEEICKKAGPKAAAQLLSVSRSYSSASMDEDSVVSSNMSMMVGGHHLPANNPHLHPAFGNAMEAARRHHHASLALKMGHQQHRMQIDGNNSMISGSNNGSSSSNNNRPGKATPVSAGKGNSREEQQPMTEEERRRQEMHLHSLGGYIVYPNDVEMIPPYVHFLMRQVEPCLFTEADRFVARSKGPVGYPGFQCRHCHGHAGLGKYFPVSSKSLSTNSTSQNIHAHMLKCRKCPDNVKEQLVQLKIEKSRAARLEPGWRKVFFDKVWKRLHREAGDNDEQATCKTQSN
ncbi:unnamed protein product [Pseudo-nitzschia multistriata]|uniref:Uncharacterized protein n=1 Tax=Pseudo-nitzschia multistriata TaxID=183589 RepID=A0A448ZAC5_9STRA|nr:unnamed protein product [Pseudo-nitzschia multistriata]